jgi:uncharacterized protein (DUF697 family)
VQANLLRVLAKLYKQDWNVQMASEFLSLLGAGIGIGYLARTVGRELIKFVPWWGQTAGAVWGATASGATTYALGKAAGYYFARRRRHSPVDVEVLRRIYAEALANGASFLKAPAGGHQP